MAGLSLSLSLVRERMENKKKRILRWLSELCNDPGLHKKMLTLTFRDEEAFVQFANHDSIARIVNYVRAVYYKQTGRRDVFCFWVPEMQRRGVPHYHVVIVSGAPFWFEFPDRSGVWRYGMTNIKTLRYLSKNYLAKYLIKGEQAIFWGQLREMYGIQRKLRTYGVPLKVRRLRSFRFMFAFRRLAEERYRIRIRGIAYVSLGFLRVLGYETRLEEMGVVLEQSVAEYNWMLDRLREDLRREMEQEGWFSWRFNRCQLWNLN